MKNLIKTFGILVSASLLFSSCGGRTAEEVVVEERTEVVRVQKLEQTTISRNQRFSTVLQAYNRVTIAPTIPGRIERINVNVGSRVSGGDLLVRMDPANYNQARAAFNNLQVDYERVARLLETNNISRQAYDQLSTQLEVQRTSLRNLQENTFLRAPFAGVIEARNYEDGELFAGIPILSLVQLSTLKSYINIPETFFPLISRGMPVTITSNVFPGETFPAEISIVYPTIDPTSHTFRAQLRIPNAEELLRPGMFATVALSFGEIESLIVPYQAVLRQQGTNEHFVFLNRDGVAERVNVTMGQRFNENIEIISDQIQEGDEMVILGQSRLNTGSILNVLRD